MKYSIRPIVFPVVCAALSFAATVLQKMEARMLKKHPHLEQMMAMCGGMIGMDVRKDLHDVPIDAREQLEIVWLERVDDALVAALGERRQQRQQEALPLG